MPFETNDRYILQCVGCESKTAPVNASPGYFEIPRSWAVKHEHIHGVAMIRVLEVDHNDNLVAVEQNKEDMQLQSVSGTETESQGDNPGGETKEPA